MTSDHTKILTQKSPYWLFYIKDDDDSAGDVTDDDEVVDDDALDE